MATGLVEARVAAALELFAAGKATTARDMLAQALSEPAAAEPGARREIARALLEICLQNRDGACVLRHVPVFLDAAKPAAGQNAVQQRRLVQEASYYLDQARAFSGASPGEILAGPAWKQEIAYDGELYLRRQVLASNLLLQSGDRPALDRSLNKILSLVGSLKNPEAARHTVAASLADVLATLLEVGETERAWGLYRASGVDIARALPPLSLDAAVYLLTVAQIHQQVGDVAGARLALDGSVVILQRIELPPAVRQGLLAQAMTLQAALAAMAGDQAAARAVLAEHPFAPLYSAPGRAPAGLDEVEYLAARNLVSAADRTPDLVALAALQSPPAFGVDPETAELVQTYRAAGSALALPPGPERQARLLELGRRLQAVFRREDAAGELGRMGAVDQLLIGLALSQADAARTPADADAIFTLFQLAGRTGASFDADALTTLAQAKDELQRRTLHQALRLRARRDRLERQQIQQVTAAMMRPPVIGILQHDIAGRGLLRDYDERLARAEAGLARDGLSLRGPRLVRLAELQAALSPDETALATAPTVGGLAYICVRRDGTVQRVSAVDGTQAALDTRLVQAALTASYPPSEALDVQFPVAAAVRLYGNLIRPVESCLRPGDRIVWLGAVATVGAPLSVLLREPPPRLGQGYDLAAADWLVRRHATSYAGSAGVIVARRSGSRQAAGFTFLGVGDPVLGEPSRETLLSGVKAGTRFAGLAALPETGRELEASARGFVGSRVLVQQDATERSLRGQVLGEYRYLSFATHGLLRDDLQGLSEPALVLTPVSAAASDDGLLTASEIADMNLRASFVALSACNTANFDFDQIAQDLPALASAFAVAGAPATLGTLWPVHSATGEAVVSGLFANLRDRGTPPADALAQAQRDFLAAPPSRAFLHPRFWAPFVVLGDGTGVASAAVAGKAPGLTAVDVLTSSGGEVVALAQTPQGMAAHFIAAPDAAWRGGEGVRLTANGQEVWRQVDPTGSASRVLARLGETLVAGGYQRGPDGRLVPRLQAYDSQGRRLAVWRGDALAEVDAGILASAVVGPSTMLIAVGERRRSGDTAGAGGGRLHILQVGPDLAPRALFDIAAPAGSQLSNATLTPLGDQLLITYTADNLAAAAPPPNLEDYDPQVCLPRRITWVELRETRTGRRLKSQTLEDVSAVAAAPGAKGGVLVAGSRRSGCEGERQAMVIALDDDLKARLLYFDESLGASEARAIARLPDGRTVVAAYKDNLVDYAPAGQVARAAGSSFSTLVFTLDRHGRASPVKVLDAGSDLVPTTIAVEKPGEVLLGGSLGGQAAIFRIATP